MDISPEPTPRWDDSLKKWGAFWEIHIFTFGAIFIGLAACNLLSMSMHIIERNKLSSRTCKCYATINFLLLFFNFVRGFSLLINPYSSDVNNIKPAQGVAFLFWGLTVPCFTASFMLMNLALLDATKMQLYSNKLQSMKFILGIVTFNFLFVFVIDITAIYEPKLYWVLYVCQILFMIFGVAVAIAMIYTGYKVLGKVKESERSIRAFDNVAFVKSENVGMRKCSPDVEAESCSTRREGNNNEGKEMSQESIEKPAHKQQPTFYTAYPKTMQTLSKDRETEGSHDRQIAKSAAEKKQDHHEKTWKSKKFRRGTKRFTIITLVISVAAILYSLIQVYSLIAVYDVTDPKIPIHPWHWIAYQTTARILEVLMSLCVTYVVRSKRKLSFCKT